MNLFLYCLFEKDIRVHDQFLGGKNYNARPWRLLMMTYMYAWLMKPSY